jgi:hypothetical protein
MTNPIDVIANAIRAADGNHTMGAGQLAEVIAVAVTDLRIIDNAIVALKTEGWTETHEGPHGVGSLSDEDLANIATIVLRSVGGS